MRVQHLQQRVGEKMQTVRLAKMALERAPFVCRVVVCRAARLRQETD
jgi:hypothetical protein